MMSVFPSFGLCAFSAPDCGSIDPTCERDGSDGGFEAPSKVRALHAGLGPSCDTGEDQTSLEHV